MTAADPLGRQAFLSALTAHAQADPRVLVLWLEGSLGRGPADLGRADRYSDVDLHLLLDEADRPDFLAGAEAWLAAAAPLVLFSRLFGGAMLNAMTAQGLRVDLWPSTGQKVELDPARARVLVARPGTVREVSSPAPGGPSPQHALTLIREFWRCISLLPAVIGRREHLVALQGLGIELGLVTELLMIGNGVVRDRGVKNLNAFLSDDQRARLEAEILPTALTPQALAGAHLRLAALVQELGPELARKYDFVYPHALEDTVLRVVQAELAGLAIELRPDAPRWPA